MKGNRQTGVLQTVENPYYGADDTEMETLVQDKVEQGVENTGYEGDGTEKELVGQRNPPSTSVDDAIMDAIKNLSPTVDETP